MLNPFKEVNWRPTTPDRRKFAVSLIIGFPSVATLMFLVTALSSKGLHWTPPVVLAGAGVAVGSLLWLFPRLALPVYIPWYATACAIGFVVGNVVLTAVFVIMFVPLGLAMRALGRHEVRKGFRKQAATYWEDAKMPQDPKRYYRQF